jgi:hypothetical protein
MARKKATTTKPKATKTKATKTERQMSQMDAAIKVLGRSRKPMSCREMVEAMTKKRLWQSPGGKIPDQTLYASILRDLRKGKDSRFKKAAPGRFTLNK